MIYIGCIAHTATGGTELLHQLASTIIGLGLEAKIFYVGSSHRKDPVAERFKKYKAPYTFEIKNLRQDDLLIVPEVMTQFLYNWRTPVPCKKIIWWLSVDNYYTSVSHFKKTLKYYLGYRVFDFKEDFYHLAQSEYAANFLRKKGIAKLGYLSDYLGDDFLEAPSIDLSTKKDIIAYNPKKGKEITDEFIKKAGSNLEFVALENMTPIEVKKTLLKAKVYIDFGTHPGKDRIPREAAMCGCCIITNRAGSAAFKEDVPIPEEYKFSSPRSSFDAITLLIEKCFRNFSCEHQKFDSYRESIKKEKNLFQSEVLHLLKTLRKL